MGTDLLGWSKGSRSGYVHREKRQVGVAANESASCPLWHVRVLAVLIRVGLGKLILQRGHMRFGKLWQLEDLRVPLQLGRIGVEEQSLHAVVHVEGASQRA